LNFWEVLPELWLPHRRQDTFLLNFRILVLRGSQRKPENGIKVETTPFQYRE
jgi:hypothetical protein